MTNNLSTQQTSGLPGAVSSLNTTTTLMNTKKESIMNDGQMKGFDGKKRD